MVDRAIAVAKARGPRRAIGPGRAAMLRAQAIASLRRETVDGYAMARQAMADIWRKLVTRIPIDPDTIRALAAVLVETGLTEIEIADKDSRIRVVRGGGVPTTVVPVAAAPVAAAAPVTREAANHPGAVVSPMVGVAYLSPEPGAAPFVTVGQQVTAGQTLLLIEAMKTFNQIKAPKAGTVTAILVQSGAPVEYGEVLAVLE
jgi:acetyl-CoA carboxylase biotin carboxyl carrier protein